MAKKYKCPYCNERYIRKDLITHIDEEHEDVIPDGFESAQVVYDVVNGTKGAGKCRVCGRPTKWSSSSKRYDVLCENPMCKQKMREEYQKNMLKVHGTYNILTSDEQQRKMLANRSISGKYKFKDGGVVTYTGSYEKKFLEFIDNVMQIPSKDIMAPGPTIEYEMNGEKHFYITDFLYIPYNLIIEVKDGGNNPNNKNSVGMQSSRQRTIEKEKLITDRGEYNYLRLTDNQFVQLLEIFMDIKKALIEGNDDKIVRINESSSKDINKCTKCGSTNIGVYLHGEPVYKCKDCDTYLGVVLFPKNESTNVFTSGHFAKYREVGEKRLKEMIEEDKLTINHESSTFHDDILSMESKNSTHNHCDKLMPLAIASLVIENYVNEEYISEANLINEKESSISEVKRIDNKYDLEDFKAYHLEPKVCAKKAISIYFSWDEEQYCKTIDDEIKNIADNYEVKERDSFEAYVYTAGKNLKPIYLGTILIHDKNNPVDWEWIEQESINDLDYEYLKNEPMVEALDISNFYDDDFYE